MIEIYKTMLGTWYNKLIPVISDSNFDKLGNSIAKLRKIETVYPNTKNVFKCFRETNADNFTIVIWGEEPYSTKDTADGLCLSTSASVTPLPLLKFLNGIEQDCYGGLNLNFSNDLTYLAKQGVLLYNSNLTVGAGKKLNHQEYWEWFSNEMVDVLNNIDYPIHVISLGEVAKKYTDKLTCSVHQIDYPQDNWNHDNCFQKANEFLFSHYGSLNTILW